jgi:hypothetical protein
VPVTGGNFSTARALRDERGVVVGTSRILKRGRFGGFFDEVYNLFKTHGVECNHDFSFCT